MYYKHGRPVADALPLRLEDKVKLPSGRVGVLVEFDRYEYTFLYAGTADKLPLSRAAVAKLLAWRS